MKKFTRAISVAAALSLVLIFPTGCSKNAAGSVASGASAAASGSAKLTVATNAEFEPFEYMEGKKIVGIDVDISTAIAKDMGKTLEVNNMDFDSVIPAITTGKFDLGVAGISKTPDREKSVDFSEPYYTAKNVIIIKDTNTAVTGKASLKGKKIAVQKGTTGDDLATSVTGDANVDRFDASADAILELKNGRADAVIIDSFPAAKFVKANPGLKILSESFDSEQYCIAVKKGNTALLSEVNKVIEKLKSDGELDKIVKNYE